MTLYTVGHGTLTGEAFTELLRGAGIGRLVDVRSYPGSRRNPQFRREELERRLPEAGIVYRWEPELGGLREPDPASPNTALRVAGFRAYADHMRSDAFREALDRLLVEAGEVPTACLCAESVWWRCHRSLLADAAVLLGGTEVLHLMHDGNSQAHRPGPEARVDAEGRLVYDGGEPTLPLG